jgi:SH3-like domain-containing protein
MFAIALTPHAASMSKTIPSLGSALALALALSCGAAQAAGEPSSGSGLPVPRFVSLKSDKVNVRAGPTKDHDVTWVYTRSGLPVEVIAEFENWRRIRDWEGAEGWVYHSLLSGRRTSLVSPATKKNDTALPVYSDADPKSRVAARLQPGVLGSVKRCDGVWCRITGAGFEGWIEQNRLWGVYPNEKVE